MMKRFLTLLFGSTILFGSLQALAEKTITVNPGEEGMYPVDADGNIFHVKEETHLINKGNFETEDGDIFHMDSRPDYTVNLSGSSVENRGVMKTNGTGHAVFADPLENQRSTTTVENYGDMYRIELSETGKSAASSLGEGSSVKNYLGAILRGSVRLGTNATLENWGTMVGLGDADDKEHFSLKNLIYFDKNGVLKNGFTERLEYDADAGGMVLKVDLTPTASITTDNISFKQSGTLYNAGLIQNERILASDVLDNPDHNGVKIYLMNNPYYETDTVVLNPDGSIDREKSHLDYYVNDDVIKRIHNRLGVIITKGGDVVERPVLITKEMDLGDKALFRADMGSYVDVDSFTVGENAQILFGADYYWRSELYKTTDGTAYNWDRKIKTVSEEAKPVTVGDEELYVIGKLEDPVDTVLNPIPRRSDAFVNALKSENNLTLSIKKTLWNAEELSPGSYVVYDGGSIATKDNSTVDIMGSLVYLGQTDAKAGSGNVTFGNNGVLNVAGYWEPKVYLSSDGILLAPDPDHPGYYLDEYEEFYTGYEPVEAELIMTENLTMGENAKVTLTGIETQGANAPQTRMGGRYDAMSGSGTLDATLEIGKKLTLGNNSTITLGGGAILSGDTVNYGYGLDSNMGVVPSAWTNPGSAEIIFGDNGTLETVDQTTSVLFAKSITFGDFGRYVASEPWDSDGNGINDRISLTLMLGEKMIFGNDGYFYDTDGTDFYAAQLNMKDRAEVHLAGTATTEIVVGNDSNVYLHGLERKGRSSGIVYGLFRQEGAKNVNLYSSAGIYNEPSDKKKIYNENFVLNGVDVDNIYIQQGGLRLGPTDEDKTHDVTGDIKGKIFLNTDTWVRFTGNHLKIHDPIAKVSNAENTLVWIDVDDAAVIDTQNTIDSDTVMIGGGTLKVHHKVTANDIVLDDAGTLQVFDENLIHANVHEYESSAANTTLTISPIRESMDSFGTVQSDRMIITNDTFNAKHDILVMDDGTKQATEGIWLGTGATLNTYSTVRTSQLIRRLDEEVGTVVNTTTQLMKGSLTVDVHVDVDTLNLKSGTFAFTNTGNVETEGLKRDMVVTNDITVGKGVNFLINGTNSAKSGRLIIGGGSGLLTVNQGGRLGLSNTNLAATDKSGVMNLKSSLYMQSGSVLDLRSSDMGSDMISATSSVQLENGVRLMVRNLKEGTNYHLLHADAGLAASGLETSFRWHGTVIDTSSGTDLYLNIGHIATLKEELDNSNVSKNTKNIGGYISDAWDGSFGPWDDIFYATTLDGAVEALSEYIPEGYVNAPQVALRTGAMFQNTVFAELNDMRQLAVAPARQRTQDRSHFQSRRSVYRGRAGGDYTRPMYQPYVRNKYQAYTPDYSGRSSFRSSPHSSFRTDRGGIWAKPFYVTATQKADKGISGYDYDSYGIAFGLDRRFGRWTWGLSGVYAQGDFEQDKKVTTTDTDTWGIGLYGNFRPNHSAFFMDMFASYMQNSNAAKHEIKSAGTTLKADYDTTSLGAGIAFGYDFALAQSLYLTPKIGFTYMNLSSDEIKEKGTAPIVMRVKNPKLNSLQLPVEVRMTFPIATRWFELLPEAHFRYTHDFGDTTYQAKAYLNDSDTPIKLDNVGMPENLFTVGGSLAYTSGKHEFSGRYDYDFGDGLTSHLFNVGYKFLF